MSSAPLAVVGGIVGALVLMQPVLRGLGNYNLLIFFVGLVGPMVFAGVPIAFSFGLATFGYLALTTRTPLGVVIGRMDEGMSHLILLSVPLFVFLGLLIEMTGMARAMVALPGQPARTCPRRPALRPDRRDVPGIGHLGLEGGRHGGGGAGAVPGDEAARRQARRPRGPALGDRRADRNHPAEPGADHHRLGDGRVHRRPVHRRHAARRGARPSLLGFLVWWRYRNEDLSHVRRATMREVGWALLIAFPAIALPFVIRAAVIEGIATATEVSTIGIVYSVIAGLLIYRQFDWRRLKPMLIETAALSGAILLIIGAATGMAWALTQSGFSRDLTNAMTGLPGGAPTFLAVSIIAFIVLGSVLEGIPAIVLFGPLLFPIAKQIGVHEVHYSMVVILAMGIGLFAPPFGVGYYAACAISRINPNEGMGPILGYMLALFIGLVIVAAMPWISIGFL